MTPILLAAATWTALGVYPYPIEKRNPDVEPPGARPIKTLEAFAAKGEYEAAAFQLKPSRAMKRVDLRPTDLTGPGGARIPADEIDIKVVKYWWRPWNSWESDLLGDLERLELTPDMLLHDDSLVKTDEKAQVNYVRADYETGSVYLNMRERGRQGNFNYSLEPVRDAPKFVPLDLEKGRYREFFVIFHVPADAPAGEYVGRLKVVEDGKDAGSLGLRLTVYPFELPRARTHYDTSREYRLMMFASLTLPTFISHGKDLAQAERRLRNVITECVKHNFLYPCSGQCKVESLDTDDLAVRTLLIWRECGLPCDPIILGSACDTAWVNRKINGERATPENDPEALRETIRTKTVPYVDRHLAAAEKFLGHRNWMLSGRDEAPPKVQRLQTGFFRAIKDRGAGIFATTMGPMYRQVGWLTDAADVAGNCSQTYAWGWHAGGATCYSYAATFTGLECPDIWRRTKGIRFYFADFDGLCEYIFFREALGNAWNGLQRSYSGGYRQMMTVFPTQDGFIGTVQFEGLREAIDDVRYYSLHRLLAEKAIHSGDPAKRAAGRAEIAWFDSTDPELVLDLDAFRREVAARIVKLQALVGPIPSEAKPKDAKPLPPCRYGATIPPNADLFALAQEYAKTNRYDLAVPVYEKIRLDKNLPLEKRLTATFAEAKLLCDTKRRDRAVEIIDAILPEATDRLVRWRTLMAKFEAILTDLVFEERMSAEHLASARKVHDELVGLLGTKDRTKRLLPCTRKFINCAGYGRHGALVEEFTASLLGNPLYEQHRCELLLEETVAFAEAGEREKAVATARKAEAAGAVKNAANAHRKFYRAFAESAAALGDRPTASRAYKALSDLYSPNGETRAQHDRYLKLSEKFGKGTEK